VVSKRSPGLVVSKRSRPPRTEKHGSRPAPGQRHQRSSGPSPAG